MSITQLVFVRSIQPKLYEALCCVINAGLPLYTPSAIMTLKTSYFIGDETVDTKTNVMRILDSLQLPYRAHQYQTETALSGVEVANLLGIPQQRVFKTLVTMGKSKRNYVFVIPVAAELDLKRAAQATSEKAIEMIKAKELLPLTGYVHGGCSPIGMKKYFSTYLDITALSQDTILFSAGKIGFQVEMSVEAFQKALPFDLVALTA